MTPAPNQTADHLERTRDVIERVYKNPLGVPESLLAPQAVLALQKEGLLLSEGAPSEQQVEWAARAFFREYHGEDIWPELRDDGELDTRSRALAATRAALTAAGVAPQEPLGDPVFRAAAAIAETQARRQNLPPDVIQGVTREHIQDAKAALAAAGVAPQEPSQNETKSGSNFVSLDAEKVAEVLLANAKSRYGGLLFEERAAARIAHAICEAYKEGKLT